MYNHKGPFYAPARSISGQRWNDILCYLWGIKDTLWLKGSQLLRWLQTGRSLVWNLNTNSDSKTKFLPMPLAWLRSVRIVRVNRVGGLPQGKADKPQWFQSQQGPGAPELLKGPCLPRSEGQGRHQLAELGRKQWRSEVLQKCLLGEQQFEDNFVLFSFMFRSFFLGKMLMLWPFIVSICLCCYDTRDACMLFRLLSSQF